MGRRLRSHMAGNAVGYLLAAEKRLRNETAAE
jgi:hypothetical protein